MNPDYFEFKVCYLMLYKNEILIYAFQKCKRLTRKTMDHIKSLNCAIFVSFHNRVDFFLNLVLKEFSLSSEGLSK